MRNLFVATGFVIFGLAGRYTYPPPNNFPSAQNASASPSSTIGLAGSLPVEAPLKLLCTTVDKRANECSLSPEFQAGLRVVIAIVPDPTKTALRLYFDRALEAIQWAA